MSSNLMQSTTEASSPVISNKMYDRLKFVAQVLLPAVAALYFGLAQIWGLPNGEQVVGTITVIDTFLGAVLLLSAKQYNNSDFKYDGALKIITTDPEKDLYSFEISAPLEDLKHNQELSIKVQKPTA